MHKIALLCLVIATATPLWSQVEPSATGGPSSLDNTQMMTPPPVSGDAYPVIVGAETRSNYLAGGIVVTGAYNDNLMVDPTHKIGDSNYSFVPSISLDRHTPRQSESLEYSSGFTLYQNTTSLNAITQEGSAEYRLHLSPYTVVSVRDKFLQNSNLFNQANPFVGGGISTGGTSSASVYLYPFANQFGNSLDGGIEYQYAKNAMIGGGVDYSVLHYSSSSANNSPGLNNSNVGEWSAFFSRRLSRSQYVGVNYEYSKITTNPVQTTTDTHTILGFYTLYFSRTVSLSILGGPQHYSSRDAVSGASSGSWTPALQGSVGYQMARMSFSAAYSRIVSNARGLVGAYHSDLASLGARRRITRAWDLEGSANYALFKNATPNASYEGGHTVAGTVSAERSFRERVTVQFGYSRFHQSYNLGTSTPLYPDCNREFASVFYSFSRPLGR